MKSSESCDVCAKIRKMIESKTINDTYIQELIDSGKIILFAANCEVKDFAYWMDKGNHYTMQAYLKCRNCDKYYFAGYCLYGSPIIKEVSQSDSVDGALRLEWGFKGEYFK